MVKMSEHSPNMDSRGQHSPEMGTTTDSSDFSVLSVPTSHSPDAVTVNGSMSNYFQDLHFALNSAVPDMSFDQLQTSFQDLLRENLQLKDDVLQSNVAMKEQFELMVKLQMHVEGIQKEQVEKHERARVVIEELRAENDALRQQMKLRSQLTLKEFGTDRTDQSTSELTELKLKYKSQVEDNEQKSIVNHQLNEEMSILSSDFANLKAAYSCLLNEKKELMAINAEFQARLTIRQNSPDEFYDASDGSADHPDQGFLLVPSKKGENDGAASQDLTLVEEKTIKNLLAQLNCEQMKNKELSTELANVKANAEVLKRQIEGQEDVIRRLVQADPAVKKNGAHLAAELRVSEEKFSMANSYLQKYRDRCDSLENTLGDYQVRLQNIHTKDDTVVDRLQAEIVGLRTMLLEEQARSTDEKKNMLDAQRRFEALLKDHQDMELEWGNFAREQASRGRQSEAYYNLQENFYREKMDALTAKLVTVEDTLAGKTEELAKVQPELQKLKQEAETIPILQTQVELYKTDFRAERDAREKLHNEKERVCEEFRALQLQYKDLQETLTQLRTSGVHIPTLERSHSRRHTERGAFWWGRSGRNSHTSHQQSSEHVPTSPPSSTLPIRDIAQLCDEGATAPYSGSTSAAGGATGTARTPPQSHFEGTPEYSCPKCGLKFSTLEPLEKHVNACLDSTEPFVM